MIKIYTLHQASEWDRIVQSFTMHDIYYKSDYVKGFQLHGDGEPLLFYVEEETFRAMSVAMQRDVADEERFSGKIERNMFYDLATPYGYGGFILEGEPSESQLQALNKAYIEACRKRNIVSEIVRFHPLLDNARTLTPLYNVVPLGKTISIPLDDKLNFWKNLSTNKKRTIKKAQKAGVKVFSGRNPMLFQAFQTMYEATMRSNNAKSYYYFDTSFYDSVLHDLQHHAICYYATFDDDIIAMVLVLYCNGFIHHHLSCSDPQFNDLTPTNLLMYTIANWGAANGYHTFHMGGGVGCQNDSLYNFKRGFNPYSSTTFSIGHKIFNDEAYDFLMEIGEPRAEVNEAFFPAYRR